jgi:hypothetical protein
MYVCDFLLIQSARTRRSCLYAQKHVRLLAGPRLQCSAQCSTRSLGSRPRARPRRTRPPLKGCYWSTLPGGGRRPPRSPCPRPWQLKPRHARELLALVLFEPGPIGAAAEQEVHQELCGRDVFELECGLGRLDNPTDGAVHAARGGVKGFANRAARAAHAGPRAAAHTIASPAVYMCSLPRKAALKSEAAMASVMTAQVYCRRVSPAFLAILEPERQGWADSGVS